MHRPFMLLNDVSITAFDDFLEAHAEASILKKINIEYLASAHQIIVCAPPKPYHDCSPPSLQRVLQSLQRSTFDTAARQNTLQVCQSARRAPNGSCLVPDAAVAVFDPTSTATQRLWPTIVVEVANSQSYENAVAKLLRWFKASEGMVEVGLLIKFTEKDPLHDPACFIEVFRCRPAVAATTPPFADGQTGSDEEYTCQLSEDEASSGGDSRIPDADLDDGDHIMSSDEADELSTTSSSSIHENDESLANTTSPNNHGSNRSITSADSIDDSKSALSDHSTLSDASSPDPSTDDSTNSRASYSSVTSPTVTLELYQDGTRQTVLPPPSPNPGTQHIALRYSDFFGSENVPAGRDRGEEVQLMLDLLRTELMMRLSLTVAQEAAARERKRKAAGGTTVGKRARKAA